VTDKEVLLTNTSLLNQASGRYKIGVDTSGIKDIIYISNNNVFKKLEVGGTLIGEVITVSDTTVLDTVNRVQFYQYPILAGGERILTWNDTDGTLEFGMKGGNVTQQIGQKLPVLVKHADNAGLENGKVVYIAGSDGSNKTVRYAQANSELTSAVTFGLMTESSTGGNKAFCTTFGLVRNINTSNLTEGKVAWLSADTAGAMTAVRPIAPKHGVMIGFCIRKHATEGIIFVEVQNGYELNELHDVHTPNPTDNQVLTWNSANSRWEAETLPDISSTNEIQTLSVASNTVSLSSGGGSVNFAAGGINAIHTVGSTITITGTEVDGSISNELQQVDTFRVNSTNLELSLTSDGQSVRTVPLSSIVTGGGGITGNGVAGYLPQYNTSTTLDTTGLFWNQTEGRLGIGTNSPTQTLSVDGNIIAGKNITILDNSGYSIYGTPQVSYTISSPSNYTSSPSLLSGVLYYSGTTRFTNLRSINLITEVRNTATSNVMNGAYFSSRVTNAGQTSTLNAFTAHVLSSTSASAGNMSSVVAQLQLSGTGSASNLYGFKVDNLINSTTGTVGNTYGVFVGDITTGNQNTVPYSFYASDADTRNFFAGNTGIGINNPVARLHVVGSSELNSASALLVQNSTPTSILDLRNDGQLILSAYPNTLNSTGSPVNVLSTSTTGVVESHPVSEIVTSGGGLTGNGVAGYLPQYNTTSTLDTSGVFWNATTGRLGIRTNSPDRTLDVLGDVEIQNPSTSYDGGIAGSDLSGSATASGWTGTSFATGYKHDSLTNSLVSTFIPASSTIYQIIYSITGRTLGSVSFTFGGISSGTLNTNVSNVNISQSTINTSPLTLTPTADFNGTISITIRLITPGLPSFVAKTAAGSITYEERYSRSTLDVFQGVEAGRMNTTGFSNVFQGYRAGYNNTTGSNNMFQGTQAGLSNTTGSNNLYQGTQSAFLTSIGNNNVFQGTNAGRSNTTGSNNVLIGFNAGRFIGTLTSTNDIVNNSIIVGFDSRTQASNQTNQIVIGYEGRGLGSNTTRIGNTSTLQTHLDGELTIGNTFYDNRVAARIVGANVLSTEYSLVVTNSNGATSTNTNGSLVVTNSGLVGVGTYSPTDPLTVSGRINQIDIGNSIWIGSGTGRVDDLSSNQNVFIGYRAGYSNTTGADNIFLGFLAGYNNTTGYNNVFEGSQSGRSNTSGYNNFFQGAAAGYSNTTGVNNLFQGVASGYSNVNGDNNIFQGLNSGTANVSGNNNIFQGINAGLSNITGSQNVFNGTSSGRFNVRGSNNVALGHESARYIGSGTTNNTRLDNSIFIGYQTRALDTAQTNQTVIGYNVVGLGSNTTSIGNSTTTQTHLYGSLTLGSTATPVRTLNVTGEARITDLTTDTPTRIVGADADGDLGEISLGSGLSITSGVLNTSSTLNTGSGTAGQVTFWNGTNSITGSSNFLWDNTNGQLVINANHSTTFSDKLLVRGSGSTSATFAGQFQNVNYERIVGFRNDGSLIIGNNVGEFQPDGDAVFRNSTTDNYIGYFVSGSIPTIRAATFLGVAKDMTIQDNAKFVGIGPLTTINAKLHVRGAGNTSGTNALLVQNSDAASVFAVRDDNVIQFNTARPFSGFLTFQTSGGVNLIGYSLSSINAFTSTTDLTSYITGNPRFHPTSGTGSFTYININSDINQTGGANGVTSGIRIAPTLTSAPNWRSIEWNNTIGYGLYGSGTAPNLLNGILSVPSSLDAIPSLTFNGDLNSGIYSTGDGVVGIEGNNLYGLQVEPTATNIALRSEEFDNTTAWVNLGAPIITRTANVVTAPDGTLTADRFLSNSNSNYGVRQTIPSMLLNTPYTFSVWMRADSACTVRIDIDDVSEKTINLTTTWQRYVVSSTSRNVAGYKFIDIVFSTNQLNKTFYVWGGQLEQSSAPSSYIKTTTETVTRQEGVTTFGTNVYGNINTKRISAMTDQPLSIFSNNLERITLLQNGNVGIGTTAPARTLHVVGEVRITDLSTDTPTKLVGADADGDLDDVFLGESLVLSGGVLDITSAAAVNASEVIIESSTATTIDLDVSGNVKTIDGGNATFVYPTNLSRLAVYKNGVRLTRSGTPTPARDFSVNTTTNEITFTTALVSTDRIVIVKL
jgi:hypothetical protein